MRAQRARGITLIELLVVVSILVLLAALVVPSLTPSIESRRLREAARGVDVLLAAVKARAIRNGRPVALVIQPSANNARACLTVSMAEVPEVYAGDLFNATMRVQTTSPGMATATISSPLHMAIMLGQGDLIQFGGKGFFYRIESVSTSGDTLTLSYDSRGSLVPWPATGWSNPLPFKIFRSPIIKSSNFSGVGVFAGTASYFQLPDGTAIDLGGSIFPGADIVVPPVPDNVLMPIGIVFSPSGGVSAIYANQAMRYLPSGTIHLLIGSVKNIQATAGDVPSPLNWLDPKNLYVSIGHQTGQIITSEVAPVSGASNRYEELWQATAYARDNFATGAR